MSEVIRSRRVKPVRQLRQYTKETERSLRLQSHQNTTTQASWREMRLDQDQELFQQDLASKLHTKTTPQAKTLRRHVNADKLQSSLFGMREHKP